MTKELYLKITDNLKTELALKNNMALPKIVKVVINVGISQIKNSPEYLEKVQASLMAITGQKPAARKSRQAISGFKIRKGDLVGLIITLRGKRMRDFIYKLANIVLPRIRDFRGLAPKGFDDKGNFTLGIAEQIAFPEISSEAAETLHGMSITIVTTAKNSEDGKKLLEAWGFPFKKGK